MRIVIDKQEGEKYTVNFELSETETANQAKTFNGINIALTRLLQEIIVRTCPNKASAVAVFDTIINDVADTLIDYIENDLEETIDSEVYANTLIQDIFNDWLADVAMFNSIEEFKEYYKDKHMEFTYNIFEKFIIISLSEDEKPSQLIMNVETELLESDEKQFDSLCSISYIIASNALECLYGANINPLKYKGENSMESVIQHIKLDTKNFMQQKNHGNIKRMSCHKIPNNVT